MNQLTLEQLYLLSRRFNESCRTPGITSVTQDEMAINDWIKERIAQKSEEQP